MLGELYMFCHCYLASSLQVGFPQVALVLLCGTRSLSPFEPELPAWPCSVSQGQGRGKSIHS